MGDALYIGQVQNKITGSNSERAMRVCNVREKFVPRFPVEESRGLLWGVHAQLIFTMGDLSGCLLRALRVVRARGECVCYTHGFMYTRVQLGRVEAPYNGQVGVDKKKRRRSKRAAR